MNWKELFFELLDEVAQIPHPMAEDIVADFTEQANEEEDE
jgi:hypothetical protein